MALESGTSNPSDPYQAVNNLLLRIANARDELALGELYDQVSPVLFGIVYGILREEREAEDVLQDVFITIWEQSHRYDPCLGKALGWMMTIARHKALDRAGRSQTRRKVLESLKESVVTDSHTMTPTGLAELAEEAVALQKAVAVLSPEQQSVIRLAFFEGMTQIEIAEHLNEPLGTIKARIRRGLIHLRKVLLDSPTTGGDEEVAS